MDYAKDIATLQKSIAELRKIKDKLYEFEERVIAIENQVGKIDSSLPDDTFVHAMNQTLEKEQILHMFDLTDEAFSLVDEILGPPDMDDYSAPEFKTQVSRHLS